LVEQRTENPCVAGSIPADTTKKSPQRNLGVFLFKALEICFFLVSSLISYIGALLQNDDSKAQP